MKRILVTAILLMGIAFFAEAQDIYVLQPDSAKIYFDTTVNPQWYYGGVWDFQCSYDTDGLLTDLRVEVFQGEDCVVRNYEYGYDSNHNLINTEYNGHECNAPGIKSRTENVFQNNLIRSQTKYAFAVHRPWAFADSTTFQYDVEERLIRKEYFNADRIHTSTVHYEYGNLEKVITTEKLQDNQWKTTKRETQGFSDDGLLLSKMIEIGNDGILSKSSLVTYSYDNQGHCMSVLTQKWENESWVNVKSVDNSYNDNGHLICATLKEWQEGTFVYANRAVYELNEADCPIVVRFEKWDGNGWIEGTWISDFYVYSEDYLNRQNKELCKTDVRRIEIYYANTLLPDYDVYEHQTKQGFAFIHPNPTNGMVTITGKDLKSVEVLDTLGQRVAKAQGQGETLQIDMGKLPAGVYFVIVTNEDGQKCVRKVVRE